MKTAAALSVELEPRLVVQQIADQIRASLGDARPDLLTLYITQNWSFEFMTIYNGIREALNPRTATAVIAESVCGVDREIERLPAVSAFAAVLPNVSIMAKHFEEEDWQLIIGNDGVLRQTLQPDDPDNVHAIFTFADPFTTPIVQWLEACARAFPHAPVVGGMASGIQAEGDCRIALDDDVFRSGAVVISVAGEIDIDCVVSQGCRPIGGAFRVTRTEKNLIEELDGRPPLVVIEEMASGLSLSDRQLIASGGLQLGRAVGTINKKVYGPGDFLIRSLLGIQQNTGGLLVGDLLHEGEIIQFHVRDAAAASEEMRLLLEGEVLLPTGEPPAGALLFTCNGRGRRLFPMPHHDISLIRQNFTDLPIAGFFAAGELGPVGQRNFIHGQTAVLALIRPVS